MTWVASAVAASAAVGLYSANKASSTQANAANQAAQISQQQYEQTRQDQMPWMQAGGRALTKLEAASDYTPFGMSQFTQDPGYAFRMKQGMNALNNQAAARGGLISGNALKAAQAYGQEMGSQEYQNAFNRYQTERQATLSPYMTLAGYGQNANALTAQTGAANAANVGNYMTGGAAANAAGMVGGANAITSGLGTYLNYNQGNSLLSALRGGGGGSPYLAGPANAPVGEF